MMRELSFQIILAPEQEEVLGYLRTCFIPAIGHGLRLLVGPKQSWWRIVDVVCEASADANGLSDQYAVVGGYILVAQKEE